MSLRAECATLLGVSLLSISALGTSVSADDVDLMVLSYPGFEEAKFHQTYFQEHGESPTFCFFGEEDEAFQKVQAGFRADLAHVCAGSVAMWRESGLIEPWDTTRIESFEDLDPNLMCMQATEGEDLYFLPTDWGSTAIAYNPDVVPLEDVASLDVLTDPRYAGRVAIPDNMDDAWALAYLATGMTDWSQGVTDAQFETAAQWLRELHPNLRTYWTDQAELARLMSTEEILVAWAWNGLYPVLREDGRPIAFQREPKESSSVWFCGLVDLDDGPGREDDVLDYAKAFPSPQNTFPILTMGLGSANAAAMAEQVTEADLTSSGLGPVDVPLFAQLPMSIEARERHAAVFEQIKAGF